jgi:DNA modification methylase
MELPVNKILCGEALETLKTLPDGSINCCISSPPYWALRDYGVKGQLGLEPTFEEYIDKLCAIYDEVKRVLRKDGTCFVNLGDTYACSPAGNKHPRKLADGGVFRTNKPKMLFDIPNKSLCLIPQRFAIEMLNRDTMDIFELDKRWIICNNTAVTNNPERINNALQRPPKREGVQHGVSKKVESCPQRPVSQENGRVERKKQRQDKGVQQKTLLGEQGKGNNTCDEGQRQNASEVKVGCDDTLWRKSSEVCLLWGGDILVSDDRPPEQRRSRTSQENTKIRLDLCLVKENEISQRFRGFVYELQLGKREIWILPPSRGQNLCLRKRDIPVELLPLFKLKKEERWRLRNTIIWHKPNPMPSSAKDRFTVDFEYIFFFVKSNKATYYIHPRKLRSSSTKKFDYIWQHKNTGLELNYQPFSDRLCKGKKRLWKRKNLWEGVDYWFEPQYEPLVQPDKTYNQTGNTKYDDFSDNRTVAGLRERSSYVNPLGRNKRCVWTIPTEPRSEAHFATYPQKLIEPMIKAGCPEYICTKCGKAREKIWDIDYVQPETRGSTEINRLKSKDGYRPEKVYSTEHHFKGYTDCSCGAEWRPGIVLDMFRWFWNDLQGSRLFAA